MNTMRCDTVRDRLPDLVRGELDTEATMRVEAHLAGCAACATERSLVEAVRAAESPVPFGLEQRVKHAVRAGPLHRRGVSTSSFAIAASVVFVFVTAALFRPGGPFGEDAGRADLMSDGASVLTGVGVPLLSDAPSLHDLSIEELETLLRELES